MKKMIYILGPCALENWEMYKDTANELSKIMQDEEWYLKASFDKANRTSIKAKRGVGLDKGVEYFYKIKEKYPNIKILTDVHEVWQVNHLKDVVDVIQIPAFLCRQTDLLVEVARNFQIINVKKGQWLKPEMVHSISQKIKEINPNREVWITERGSVFGYDKLLVDFGARVEMSKTFDKVIFDVTHSTQEYSSSKTTTGGNRHIARKYFLSSPIFKYDGVFAEIHPNPSNAISDKDSQIKLDRFKKIFKQTKMIGRITNDLIRMI